jgi:hypothetical protein
MLTKREFEQVSILLESRKKVTVGEVIEILKLWTEPACSERVTVGPMTPASQQTPESGWKTWTTFNA